MNFGDCPYCDGFISFYEVPNRCPAYATIKCESCGKDIWYRFSRINPQSWTIEDFKKEFIVDSENKKIIERNPKPTIELPKEIVDAYCKLVEDYFINGDPSGIKPTGFLKHLVEENK